MSVFGTFLGKLIGGDAGAKVVDYFNQKQQLKQQYKLAKLQGKIDVQKAKDSLAVQQLQSDTQLEHDQLTSVGNSLRQDWVLMLLSTPLVMAFIPPLQPYVESGFKALSQCPGWYKYTTVTVLLAIYGIRKVSPFFNRKGDKNGTQSDDKENG